MDKRIVITFLPFIKFTSYLIYHGLREELTSTWIEIIFAFIAILSFISAADKESILYKQRGMHMAAICVASIIALAADVIFS